MSGNSPGQTFSWNDDSRSCPDVCERIQMIMKQWVGNAHGDQSVWCLWEKRVSRIDFRDGLTARSRRKADAVTSRPAFEAIAVVDVHARGNLTCTNF